MVLRWVQPIRGLFVAALAMAAAQQASADSLISPETAIPDHKVLINFGGTGLDWVYAGPFAPFGDLAIEGPEYRAAEGWRHATDEEWALRPDWTDFIRDGFTADDVLGEGATDENYRFASAYWSLHDYINVDEAAMGWFSRDYDGHPAGFILEPGETWYVRTTAAVPDAATSLPLVLLSVVGLLACRRGAVARL